MGFDLSRQTMSSWLLKAVELNIELIDDEMKRQMLKKGHLHADETSSVLQVDGYVIEHSLNQVPPTPIARDQQPSHC